MSQLTPEQLAHVEQWASEGANLNEVQDRLKKEFAINLTYLDARLLMLDIGVKLKEKPKPVEKPAVAPAVDAPLPAEDETWNENFDDATADSTTPCEVKLTADEIAIPGALISGKVTFSDGQTASWFLDQMGRLGLNGAPQGYQPPPADVPLFQQQLDGLLQKSGF